MTPVQRLTEDMKNAMRNKNRQALDAIRFLLAQVKNAEIDKLNHEALTDDEFTKIVRKLVKNAEEAVEQYRSGERLDLVEDETGKIALWKEYLPEQLSDDAIRTFVSEVLSTIEDRSNMGQIMGKVMAKVGNKADGTTVSRLVREAINS